MPNNAYRRIMRQFNRWFWERQLNHASTYGWEIMFIAICEMWGVT